MLKVRPIRCNLAALGDFFGKVQKLLVPVTMCEAKTQQSLSRALGDRIFSFSLSLSSALTLCTFFVCVALKV